MAALGFDSGGSRTSFAMVSDDGTLHMDGSEAGASISDARDHAAVNAAIDWIMDVVEEHADDETVVWIGAAGFSGPTAKGLESMFAPRVKRLVSQLEKDDRQLDMFIANDAVSLLKAPPLNGSGVVAIVGTGSVVLGAHPACTEGVVKRGGSDWLVSDEGAGVWMTIQAIRLIMQDLEARGSRDYRSPLLDRLAEYIGISEASLADIPLAFRQQAKAEAVARKMAESRPDLKRYFAHFVYPNIFDLSSFGAGMPHDPIAAEVLQRSVQEIAKSIKEVSGILAAYTSDEPNLREQLPVVVGGRIAANPLYDQRLRVALSSEARYVGSVNAVGDGADEMALLAWSYLNGDSRERRAIAKSFDPMHPVLRLV